MSTLWALAYKYNNSILLEKSDALYTSVVITGIRQNANKRPQSMSETFCVYCTMASFMIYLVWDIRNIKE